VLRQTGRRVRLLTWSIQVHCKADAGSSVRSLESGAVGLNTLRAQERVCPMRTIHGGAVRDGSLCEGPGSDCGGRLITV
jgi:hypothetical protein